MNLKEFQSKESIFNINDVTTLKHRYDESNADDTLLLDSKNFVSVNFNIIYKLYRLRKLLLRSMQTNKL
jgi:hypothetical protein